MARLLRVENTTRQTVVADRGELADNPWRRLRGLLGRAGLERGQGLVIRPCQGVHTWFMSFPIDVLHVDGEGVVREIVPEMAPNRIGPVVWQARYVVELPAGAARASGTEVGDRLMLAGSGHPAPARPTVRTYEAPPRGEYGQGRESVIHTASAAKWSAAGAWSAVCRVYQRFESTERGYIWLNRLGPAYLFGLVAIMKAWTFSGMLWQIADGETSSLESGLLASYQAVGFVFFGLVAGLYMRRSRPVRRVAGPVQGLVAMLGSFIMLPVALSGAQTDNLGLLLAADAMMVVGTGGAALALASLGRCFGIFPEARGLVTYGAYRSVRHPMYLFEFIAFLGVLLPAMTPLNVLLYVAFAAFQVARMGYEEQMLAETFPREYPAYRARTARLIPGLY